MEDSYVLQLQEPKFREFYLSYSGYAQCGPLHCYGPASRPQQILENLKVLDSASFSEEELKKIDECSLAL